MKKYFLVISLMAISLLIVLTSCGKKVEETTKTPIKAPTEMKDSVIIVTVGIDSMNALEVLKQSHEVNEVPSAMGTFVKGINGVENDMHTFWFFEVNNEMANKAADRIMTTPSDTIRWYFRQPSSESSADGAEKPDENADSL